MSRVHDAIQRAGERASGPDTVTGAAEADAVEYDAATLAAEPFPVELAARRASASEAPPRPAAAFTAAAAAATPAVSARKSSSSVFEKIDARLAEKVVLDDRMLPASREQYRRLAGVLHDAQTTTGLRVLMIASAVSGEGKTLTAANLALTLSESYRKRVLLIDADLRRPTLHTIFAVKTAGGLSEGLDTPDSKLMIRQISDRLAILPAGRPNSDPMALLTSERMHRLIAEARDAFDWVIVDTPPIILLPDANLLSTMVDGVVLVLKAESTPHALVKRATDAIGHKRLLGVVLNQATAAPNGGYGTYGSYYGYYGGGDAAEPGAER
jgi:protein-tyrosine kinase